MSKQKPATFNFCLQWKCSIAEHSDSYVVEDIDFENDILPLDLKQTLINLALEESASQTISAQELLGAGYETDKVISFDAALFNNEFKQKASPPILYRFYPSAIAWEGLNKSHKDYTPFRLIAKNDDTITADCNHPLAKYYLTLVVTKISETNKLINNRPSRDIAKMITSRGPGMQAPFEFGEAVFFKHYPFKTIAINKPKPTIDSQVILEIESLFSELLPKHSKVLDVMSNNSSYLSAKYQSGLLVGIGSNETELSNNPRLDTYVEQDINVEPNLPYEDNSFDNAICTLMIDNFTSPLALMREIARVVTEKGKFIIVFTDESYADKSISLWFQLHPFERMQLVIEYFRISGLFADINSRSIRGILKSSEAIKKSKSPYANLYAVWGAVN